MSIVGHFGSFKEMSGVSPSLAHLSICDAMDLLVCSPINPSQIPHPIILHGCCVLRVTPPLSSSKLKAVICKPEMKEFERTISIISTSVKERWSQDKDIKISKESCVCVRACVSGKRDNASGCVKG